MLFSCHSYLKNHNDKNSKLNVNMLMAPIKGLFVGNSPLMCVIFITNLRRNAVDTFNITFITQINVSYNNTVSKEK